ncbi:MAG: diacylglycerol/lipid kinase family protein [Myxococcota bacterium]
MKVLVLSNPVAGKGRGERAARVLVERLEARGHGVERFDTHGPGDARRRAAERTASLGPSDRIVVVGGDGTLNEVVNGLPDPGRVPIVQLAVGTANMLARELGWPRRLRALAALVALVEEGEVRRIDLGRIGPGGGQRFVMNASCGFDAMVTRRIREARRGTLGFRGYVRPVLGVLRRYQEPRLRVRVDDDPPREGALVLVSNLRNYGGLFRFTERARCDSGHLDIRLFHRARPVDLVRYGCAGLLRCSAGLRGSEALAARRVRIESATREPVPVQLDGDAWGTTPVEIEVAPAALAVVTPPGGRPARPGRDESGARGPAPLRECSDDTPDGRAT